MGGWEAVLGRLKQTDWQNSQGRPGLQLDAVLPHAILLMPLRGLAGHEMHFMV